MRKVLWIVLLAALALPMLSETASARHRRGGCCTPVYYAPPVPCCNVAPTCCGSAVYTPPVQTMPPAIGQQPGVGQPPAGVPEPPRPTKPPIE